MEALVYVIVLAAIVAVVGGIFLYTRRRGGLEAPPRPRPEEVEAPGVDAEAAEEPTLREPPTITEPAPPSVELVGPSLRDRLRRSRKFLSDRLADALHGAPDDETWEDLEAALIQADIGVTAATRIVEDLKGIARERRITDAREVRGLLADELVSLFDVGLDRALTFAPANPTVWLVVGVNGTGKTTTIGKLSADLRNRGRTVAMAAADTFRAAADEQLGVWADRTGATLVKHQPGADPGAVAFDAYKHARARSVDVLIVDTAGRLHTKTPLMAELSKVRRVIEKEGEVHEALLVIDATAGQNGLVQAKEFAEAIGVTGVVLTKLDGTAKGGIALAIEETLGIPIKLIGVGEALEDLEPFDPKTFVDALLA
jgi:fused signal recognition particle receptor